VSDFATKRMVVMAPDVAGELAPPEEIRELLAALGYEGCAEIVVGENCVEEIVIDFERTN
jgi:hypothetical protein